MTKLQELTEVGQSIWLDYIRRSLIAGGELQRLVDEGLRGVTSNPTIFQKAIAGSTDYDADLRALLDDDPHSDSRKLYETLAITDIVQSADVLRPVYEETKATDGFVSLEVSPHLAHDTEGTIAEARRLWQAVDRPNLMIKVPATPSGVVAIEELLAEGINVNATLIFSLSHYESVAQAYIRGVARAEAPGRVSSVASFFISRVDVAVDRALEAAGQPEALALRGTAGIANAKVAYARFREIFASEAWKVQERRGAHVQRPLWASTGTKNPAYSDVLYVENLIGPDTVNTLPPATLQNFRDHGHVLATSIEQGVDEARGQLAQLEALGLDLETITENLQAAGVSSFAASFDDLLQALHEKRNAILAGRTSHPVQHLGAYEKVVASRLQDWADSRFARRLWEKDPTLWSPEPLPELADRMGWLTLPISMHDQIDALRVFANEVKDEGIRHLVLLGMGGSSLSPKVFQGTFGNRAGYPELIVLDSTHPDAVRAVGARVKLSKTLFLVASKSGTTTETLSFFHYFWEKVSRISPSPGDHFVAITDPGTALESLAKERRFRRTFSSPADVGGRYSALSVFGLVPAALIGVDIHSLLDRAWTMTESCAFCVSGAENPGLALGAALGELALAGRDKVTFVTSPSLSAFPIWAEQLIAESTGKEGKGIVPVADESVGPPAVYGQDRVFVSLTMDGDEAPLLEQRLAELEAAGFPVIHISLADKAALGQEFFRWEVAVAAAGAVLGIHPFNQPDVQLAKRLAREAMAQATDASDESPSTHKLSAAGGVDLPGMESWLAEAKTGDYLGLQAYLAPTAETTKILQEIRMALRDRLHLATTFGYGPRFLHSTGQLHKGGPNNGLFLQLVDSPAEDLAVPETDYTFGTLIEAQSQGDYQALTQRGRRVLRLQLDGDVSGNLRRILEFVRTRVTV
ncbi:MAG: bifunctional transaldolase/phosoglucose isomerase [Chloroflexi bacterium]|nr:bifunctional transaldolase/phosoglucose isomerase [Chloroflexota bacterium]